MPENIFDVGHKVIDAIEEGVQTGSNAVHGIINDIEDQTGQNFFMGIYGKACVRDSQCHFTSYCSSCKYFPYFLS